MNWAFKKAVPVSGWVFLDHDRGEGANRKDGRQVRPSNRLCLRVLAKKYGLPVVEYKEIAKRLFEKAVLSADEAERMRKMAGYGSRMVHFYHEVSAEEHYEICLSRSDEIRSLLRSMLDWIG